MQFSGAVLCLLVVAEGAKFPKNLKKCDRNQPSFKQCLLEAIKEALPGLTKPYPDANLPSLDPLEIQELSIGTGSKGVVAVNQNFQNCKLYGIDKSLIDNFDFDFEQGTVNIGGVIPEIKKLCDYELNGRVLLLPIVGKGHSEVTLKDVRSDLHLNFEEISKRNKTFIDFTKDQLTITPKLVTFRFKNLNNGNKVLGDNINNILNENWKEVFDDTKGGYEQALGLIIRGLANRFFSKFSITEVFE